MSIYYLKTCFTVEEQLHEEEVLYNEAVRMNASPDVLKSIKDKIEIHKMELVKRNHTTSFYNDNQQQSFY